MKIAGLWNSHDSSFCVLEDGVPTIHAELERYTREKEPKGDSFKLFKQVRNEENDIDYWVTCSPAESFKDGSKRCVKVSDEFNHEIYSVGHHQAHAAAHPRPARVRQAREAPGGLLSIRFEACHHSHLRQRPTHRSTFQHSAARRCRVNIGSRGTTRANRVAWRLAAHVDALQTLATAPPGHVLEHAHMSSRSNPPTQQNLGVPPLISQLGSSAQISHLMTFKLFV